jgi:hypothetical protein
MLLEAGLTTAQQYQLANSMVYINNLNAYDVLRMVIIDVWFWKIKHIFVQVSNWCRLGPGHSFWQSRFCSYNQLMSTNYTCNVDWYKLRNWYKHLRFLVFCTIVWLRSGFLEKMRTVWPWCYVGSAMVCLHKHALLHSNLISKSHRNQYTHCRYTCMLRFGTIVRINLQKGYVLNST